MRFLDKLATSNARCLATTLIANMREPLALVLRNLSGAVHRICVDRQIAILVDSAKCAVASLHQMFQIGVFREIELLSGSHIGKLWHELLKECKSSGSF